MTVARRRVAVTGLGLVTPLGVGTAETWAALIAGRSAIGPIAQFDASGFPVRIAAEVLEFDSAAAVDDSRLRKLANRDHAFALVGAEEALRDAGTRPTPNDAERWGCVVGSGMMGVRFEELVALQCATAPAGTIAATRLLTADVGRDPLAFCRQQNTAGLGLLLRRYGMRGYASSVHTACASGGQAIGTAAQLVRRGVVDAALAGGFDAMITPVGLAGFCLLGALSSDNDAPGRASRPFDATRNGFVLGEGAGFVVLESWERARARGACCYAELAGEGNSLSSYRITDAHPSGDGPVQAMRRALDDAGVRPEAVDYLNAHGTSTPMNDRSECAAVRAVFGPAVERLRVSSTKSLMGHLIAAAGAVEAAVCALAIRHGVMPVNANLVTRDPECDLSFVGERSQPASVRIAMSNSLGFGGSNNTLVLRHPALVAEDAG